MQRISRISRWWIACGAAVAGAAAAIVGCGPDRPKMTPVTGTVTLSGKPLEGVAVMFVSKGGRPAHGTTDASGRFTLGTFEASDGALVGENTVVFSKVVPVHPGASAGEPANAHSPAAATRETLPPVCTSIMDSPFVATVAAGEENDFTFDLGKAGSEAGRKPPGR
ncbi:MAG: hypothetical protein NTW96_16205 [Planctomycetia bacterium]|nr:hypothetical protein [Planctomycetia bacterium]